MKGMESVLDIKGLTKRLPCHVDVLQPDIARTARAGEHGLGYVDAHHLREMFSRNVGDAACPAGKVEAFLLGAAQSPQGCFDQGFFEFGPERGVISRFIGSLVLYCGIGGRVTAPVIIGAGDRRPSALSVFRFHLNFPG
jgi:hypothetical protein